MKIQAQIDYRDYQKGREVGDEDFDEIANHMGQVSRKMKLYDLSRGQNWRSSMIKRNFPYESVALILLRSLKSHPLFFGPILQRKNLIANQ